MPVQIGAKAHSFSDPTGLLSDCHRRIEMFLESLQSAEKNAIHLTLMPCRRPKGEVVGSVDARRGERVA